MISVLMPVFNSEDYLPQAIESILGQSCADFEFLILDDGSEDNSPAICKKYAQMDSRIKFNAFEHQGYSPLLNRGLEMAHGKYIARMDSDDIALRDRLKDQVEFLEQNPEFVAVGCQVMKIDPDGDRIGMMKLPVCHDDIDHSQVYKGKGAVLHPGSMIRKEVLTKIGGYRPEFEPGEDFDLFLRLAEEGKLANLDKLLMLYRVHFKNITVTKKHQHQRVKQQAINEAFVRRKIHSSVPEIKLLDTPSSESDNHFIWMHMALESGFYVTARKNARLGWQKSQKNRRDYYNYLMGIFGPVTRMVKTWRKENRFR